MLTARYKKFNLNFSKPAGTSRGILLQKTSYFIIINDTDRAGVNGIGECSLIKGLSFDDRPGFEKKLAAVCNNINDFLIDPEVSLSEWPAIRMGLETAMADLTHGGSRLIFPSEFSNGNAAIPIHGLIWMGDREFIIKQIDKKLSEGYKAIKMKIGALAFDEELKLIEYIRKHPLGADLEIRLDANGAFSPGEALEKLKKLAGLRIHSIEQPIMRGQTDTMTGLCRNSPVPIALDEELIGISNRQDQLRLLEKIRPQFIVIKPSLLGGYQAAASWICEAMKTGSGWWINSALESNIGLNAIAQWTTTLKNPMVQGLGTGSLFSNNISSPLMVNNGELHIDPALSWDISSIIG